MTVIVVQRPNTTPLHPLLHLSFPLRMGAIQKWVAVVGSLCVDALKSRKGKGTIWLSKESQMPDAHFKCFVLSPSLASLVYLR